MRYLLAGITLVFAALTSAHAQPLPGAVFEKIAQQKRLDEILEAWSARMLAIKSVSAHCKRTRTDGLTRKTGVWKGEILFQRPNLAKIHLINQNDNKDFEKILFTQTSVYAYSPKEKVVSSFELAEIKKPHQMRWIDDLYKDGIRHVEVLAAFLTGMKVAGAKQDFTWQLQKENEDYAYLLITPKTKNKAQFVEAQLALYLKTPRGFKAKLEMMPARFWYREPSGNEVTYLFDETQPDVQFDASNWEPTVPKGWTRHPTGSAE